MNIPTCTVVHTCLDVVIVKYVHNIPGCICNRYQVHPDLQRDSIYFIDSDYGYIIYEILCRDKIEHKRDIKVEYD